MKAILIFCLISVCCAAPLRADECCESKSTAVEQRLRDIDLSIALKQYEEIQTERARAEVNLVLLDSSDLSDADRDKQTSLLRHRVQALAQHADRIRARIMDMSKPISVAAK